MKLSGFWWVKKDFLVSPQRVKIQKDTLLLLDGHSGKVSYYDSEIEAFRLSSFEVGTSDVGLQLRRNALPTRADKIYRFFHMQAEKEGGGVVHIPSPRDVPNMTTPFGAFTRYASMAEKVLMQKQSSVKDQRLLEFGRNLFHQERNLTPGDVDLARNIAFHIGIHAWKSGFSLASLKNWFRVGYGMIWVREGGVDPGKIQTWNWLLRGFSQ